MKCLILKIDDEFKNEEQIEEIHTLEEFADLVEKLGGTVQVQITPLGWIVDDFRKLLK